MKKVDSLKNSVANVLADNAGEKKKILDGCKFCMEKRGCKCDKAEELFDQPSILSPYSPDNWVKASEFISEKPLNFPLKCYEYGPAFLRYCEDCQIVYKKRWYFKDDGMLEDLYCGTLGDVCPHCGKLGTPVSDLYQATYGPYIEETYYYPDACPPCPYCYGNGCPIANSEHCVNHCFTFELYMYENKFGEVYDILAGYYDEDEYDDFGGLKAWEVGEILQQIALEEALSMCYDELGGYFSEDEDTCYRDDEEEYWHFNCYEELYWVNEYDWLDEEYWFDVYDLERYYCSLAFQNITMSTREIMVALDLVESIFCGNQHPTNEENYQRNVEFFRRYEADDAYRLTPCYGTCDSMCELCPFDGREKEYVFKSIEGRLNYAKANLPYIKEQLFSLYAELLDISLILNQTVNGDFNKMVSLIRKICKRVDEKDADNLVALVVSLFETAKALARVDTSYMRAKDDIEVNT